MKYKNPIYKKQKNSYKMLISCGPCKSKLVLYQKVGVGNLLRMHLPRVIEANVDLWNTNAFICPNCHEHLGDKISIDGHTAFKIRRGYVHTKRLD